MIGITASVRDVAEKMAPSATARRIKLETAASHALRMQEVSMEVEIVRADIRHLPLLLPLFDQYRSFFAQLSELERLEEFLRERLTKGQTTIFVALPVNGADKGVPQLLPMQQQGGGGSAAAASSVPHDPSLSSMTWRAT